MSLLLWQLSKIAVTVLAPLKKQRLIVRENKQFYYE